ncbi:RNA polymerase I-specific transcription initiation factor RRN3 [Hygrophoropsis aurantiaca]|uniref:RNA polymerase I-specific transcription initiation factor RRN3 n=1 Tax=Hygrophoropsis aurantiaca TaxID=72124 RepID=A0ACB8A2S3_9AGAM|nr:RNA polymerase I-specific transcription initiation factor RRN3 [Hygrophoropsis aurantiaca]
MDPHSRRSQFNQRTPKTGPHIPTVRFMEPSPKISLDKFTKPSTSSKAQSGETSPLFTQRPIATNSRIKQDEQHKKDMFLAFVNKALQEKLNGQSKDFDDLVDQFNPKKTGDNATPTTQLRLWIIALSHVLSRLERRHFPLVEAIVNLPWTTMDNAFVKSYTVFVGMLLSARPEYLSLVLSKITQGFTHQSGIQALHNGGPESSSTPLTRRVIYDRLHFLLRHLLSLIPTMPSTLQPLLVRNFPHKRQSQVAQVTYIRNLLRITEYCSELADRMLATIIDRAIQIDVEIQVELEELEEDETQDHGDVFEFDPFDTPVGQEGEESESDGEGEDEGDDISDLSSDDGERDDGPNAEPPSDTQHIHDMVNKLDAILTLIFDHFNNAHAAVKTHAIRSSSPSTPRPSTPFSPLDSPRASSPISEESGRALRTAQFHTLLSIFDRTIIRTFKSRYTQFLIFWYSSLDPEFSDLFQGLLVEKALLGKDIPAVTRAAAASYIASFVSRAQFVDRDGARRVISVLCAFLRTHLDAFDSIWESGQALPSMAHHSVFYAIAQAVFLIFCFRWRDLQEEEDDLEELQGRKKWMTDLNVIQRAITSSLNPLKICSSNVVGQFARVAQATDFIYCYSILEANKRSEYNNGTGQQKVAWSIVGEKINPELHTFFPFDPYKLPRSSSYIQGVYREWSSVAIDDEEDEENGDGDDVDEEDAQDEELVPAGSVFGGLTIPGATSQDNDMVADGLGESFGGMSISPAQPRAAVVAMS